MSSSLVHTMELDVEIKASADQFYDLLCKKPHHIKHASAEMVQACELLEGDWGTNGSILLWSYVHGGKSWKTRDVMEGIDHVKNSFSMRVVEGDLLEEYKSFKLTVQATPKSNGEGSLIHFVLEYERKHEGIGHPETKAKFLKEVSQEIDAFLIKKGNYRYETLSSSLVHKIEFDVEIKASADKFHDFFCKKPYHIKHVSTDKIQGCELLQGYWGTNGSILHWNYTHDGKPRKVKHVVEGIDPIKNSFSLRVVEGDLLEEYKSFGLTVQATPKSNGEGSVVHFVLEYERKHEGIDHPETLAKFVHIVSQDIDAFLNKGN